MAKSESSCRSRRLLYTDHGLNRKIVQLHNKDWKQTTLHLLTLLKRKGIKQKQQTKQRASFIFLYIGLLMLYALCLSPPPRIKTHWFKKKRKKVKRTKIFFPPVFYLILYVPMCECVLLFAPPNQKRSHRQPQYINISLHKTSNNYL